MKKKIIAFLCAMAFLAVAIPAQAQLRFGVKGGLNITSVHFDSDLLKSDNVTGFHIGPMIEATMPLLGFGFDAALLYSQKGMESSSSGVKTTMKTSYIDVPVNLKWKFGLPIVKAYLAAGPYASFRVGGDKIWNVLSDQLETKSFGAGLNFGAGVEVFNHLQVGFNYELGLTDNFSAEKLDLSSNKNRGWTISAAILF
jgi:hypothetical protein